MTTFTGNRQGTPITEQQAKQASTYIGLGWQPKKWTTNGDTTFPQLIPNGYDLFKGIIQGTKITESQAKQKTTYESLGWDFNETWKIDEGQSYPYLWNESRVPSPDPDPEPQPTEETVFVKVEGVWHPQEAMYIKVDGVWKQVEAIMTKLDSAWK